MKKSFLTLMLAIVSGVWMTSEAQINSLCDEWNILGISTPDGYDHFNTFTQRLTTDTIIGDFQYVRLEQSGYYIGAMREGYNRDIYYVPNGTAHEYLLCAFNAQAGDTLYNMWVGGHFSEEHNGKRAVIREIQDTNPRTFVVEYEYTYNADKDTIWWPYYWIEGVGMSCGPSGDWCPFLCAGDYGELVLCAYKNGEQVYISEKGEQYGCEYNRQTINSLCDEWNIVLTYNYENATRYCTYTQKLTTDTIIGEQVYVKSDYEHKYIGAFREGENRDIYCVPAKRNEEYLMYAWNAQVGDTLYNLLVGGGIMYALQFSDRAVVREIKETTPRTFVVDYEYIYNRKIDGADTTWWEYQWIEGVGMTCGPSGDICPFNFWVKSDVLCAYKDEEQVYQSEFAQEHGCVYDEIVCADTIPIYSYVGDDPGSSTVDPVDPNQVVVTLKGDELTIKDYSGETITYSVKKESGNNAPRRMPMYEDTFQDSVSVELTEEGQYRLDLTNPNWDYRIYGVFSYPHSPQDISEVAVPACSVEKMLRDGELLIRKGNAIYTVTGIRVE